MQNFTLISDLASILTSEAAFQSTNTISFSASKSYIWFLGQIWISSWKHFQTKTVKFHFKYNTNNLPKITLHVYKFANYLVSLHYMLSLQNQNQNERVCRRCAILRRVMISATDRKKARSQLSKFYNG